MRPVEYMPELQEERAAVSTTKLTMPAPAGMPDLLEGGDERADAGLELGPADDARG